MARTRSLGVAANSNNNQNNSNSAKADTSSSGNDIENDDKMKSNDVRVTRRSVTNTKDSASPSPTLRGRKQRTRQNHPKNASNKTEENTESAEENTTNFIDLIEDDSSSQKQLQLGMDDQFDSSQTDAICSIEDDQNFMSVIEIVDDQDGILGSYIGSEEIVIEESAAGDYPSSMGEIEISNNTEDEEYSQQYYEYEVLDMNSQDNTVEVEITTDECNVQPSMEKEGATEDENVEIAVVVEEKSSETYVPEVSTQKTSEELEVVLAAEKAPKKPVRTYGNKRKGKVTASALDTRIEQVTNEVKDIEIDVNKKIVETQLPQQLTEKLSIKDAAPPTNPLEPSRRSQRKVIKKYDVKELFARKPKASQNSAKSEKKIETPTAKSIAIKTESPSKKNSSIAHIDLTQIPSLDSGNINNIVLPIPLEIAHDDNSFLRSEAVKRRARGGRKSNKGTAQNLSPAQQTLEKATVITIEDDGDEIDLIKSHGKPTTEIDHVVNLSPEKTFNSVQNVVNHPSDSECVIISPEKAKSESRIEIPKVKQLNISPKLKKEVEFIVHTDDRPRTPTRASVRKSGKNVQRNLVPGTKLITMEKIAKLDYSKKNEMITEIKNKNFSIETSEPARLLTIPSSSLVTKSDLLGKTPLNENKEKLLVVSLKKNVIATQLGHCKSSTEISDSAVSSIRSLSTLGTSNELSANKILDEHKQKLLVGGFKKKDIPSDLVHQKSFTETSDSFVSLNKSLSTVEINSELSGKKPLDENTEKLLVGGRKKKEVGTELGHQKSSTEIGDLAESLNKSLSTSDTSNELVVRKPLEENEAKLVVGARRKEEAGTELEHQKSSTKISDSAISLNRLLLTLDTSSEISEQKLLDENKEKFSVGGRKKKEVRTELGDQKSSTEISDSAVSLNRLLSTLDTSSKLSEQKPLDESKEKLLVGGHKKKEVRTELGDQKSSTEISDSALSLNRLLSTLDTSSKLSKQKPLDESKEKLLVEGRKKKEVRTELGDQKASTEISDSAVSLNRSLSTLDSSNEPSAKKSLDETKDKLLVGVHKKKEVVAELGHQKSSTEISDSDASLNRSLSTLDTSKELSEQKPLDESTEKLLVGGRKKKEVVAEVGHQKSSTEISDSDASLSKSLSTLDTSNELSEQKPLDESKEKLLVGGRKKKEVVAKFEDQKSSTEISDSDALINRSLSTLDTSRELSEQKPLDESKEKLLVRGRKKNEVTTELGDQKSATEKSHSDASLNRSLSTLDISRELSEQKPLDESTEKLLVGGRKKKEVAKFGDQKSSTEISDSDVSLNKSLSTLDTSNELSEQKPLNESKEKLLVRGRKKNEVTTELGDQKSATEISDSSVSLNRSLSTLDSSSEPSAMKSLDENKEKLLVGGRKKKEVVAQLGHQKSLTEKSDSDASLNKSLSTLDTSSELSEQKSLVENKEKLLVGGRKKKEVVAELEHQKSSTEISESDASLNRSLSTLDTSNELSEQKPLDESKEKLLVGGRKKKEVGTELGDQKTSTEIGDPAVSLNRSLSTLDSSSEPSANKSLDENKEKLLIRSPSKKYNQTELEPQKFATETSDTAVSLNKSSDVSGETPLDENKKKSLVISLKKEDPSIELGNDAVSAETNVAVVSLTNSPPSLEKSTETKNKENMDKGIEKPLVKTEESCVVSPPTPDKKGIDATNTLLSTIEEVNVSAPAIRDEENKSSENKSKKKARATKNKIPRDLANILDISCDCTPLDFLEDNKEEISPRRTRREKRSLNNTPNKDLDKIVSPKHVNLINKVEKEDSQIKELGSVVEDKNDALNEFKTEQTTVTCGKMDGETSSNIQLLEKTLMEEPSIYEKVDESKIEVVISSPVTEKDICNDVKIAEFSSPKKSLEDQLKEVLGITTEETAEESHEIKTEACIKPADKIEDANLMFGEKEVDVEQTESIKETPKRRKAASKVSKSASTKQKQEAGVVEKQPTVKEGDIKCSITTINDSEERRIFEERSVDDAKDRPLELNQIVIGSETEICVNEVEIATEEESKNCPLKELQDNSEEDRVSDYDNLKQFENLDVLINPDIQSEVECKTENSEDTYDDLEQIPQPQTEETSTDTKDEKISIKEISRNQTKVKLKRQTKTFSEMLTSIDQMRDLKEKTGRRRSAKANLTKEKSSAESLPTAQENKNASESDTSSDNVQKSVENNKIRRNRKPIKMAEEEKESSFKDIFFAALGRTDSSADKNSVTKTNELVKEVQVLSSEDSKKDEVSHQQQKEVSVTAKPVIKLRRKSVLPRSTQITRVPTKGMKKMLPEAIQNVQLECSDAQKPVQVASELEIKSTDANEKNSDTSTAPESQKDMNKFTENPPDTEKDNAIERAVNDSQMPFKELELPSQTLDSSKQDVLIPEKPTLEQDNVCEEPLNRPPDSQIETEKISTVNSTEVVPVAPITTKVNAPKSVRSPRKRKLSMMTTGDSDRAAASPHAISGQASNFCIEKEDPKSIEANMKEDEDLKSQVKKKRNRKPPKSIKENEITPLQDVECKEPEIPVKKRRSKKKLGEETPSEPKSEIKKDLTVAELIEIIEKTRSMNPISKNITTALAEESKQNSENSSISSTLNKSEEKEKTLEKSQSITEQNVEKPVHDAVDRNFDHVENTVLSVRKIRSKQTPTVLCKKGNDGLKAKSNLNTNFSKNQNAIEENAYIQVANDMINEEISQSKSNQSALNSKSFGFKLTSEVPPADCKGERFLDMKTKKNGADDLPISFEDSSKNNSFQNTAGSEQGSGVKKPERQYSSENNSQTSSSSDSSNDCKAVKQMSQTPFDSYENTNFPNSTKSKPEAKKTVAKNARRKSRNNKNKIDCNVSFNAQIESDSSGKYDDISKISPQDGQDTQKIETIKEMNKLRESNVSKEPKVNDFGLFEKPADLPKRENRENSFLISKEETKSLPKADSELDEVAAIEQEFKNLEMQLRCGAVPEIVSEALGSTIIPTPMVPPPLNETNQNELEKETLQDAENVNIIRRSHRIKTQTKSLNVGRGLVKDKERFGSDSSGKTSEEPSNNKNNVIINQIPEMDAMNKAIIEQRMKEFVTIKENEYKCDRVISKEAKKMICDCFLTREEEDRGELGCGEDCLNRLLMIECGQKCVVGDRCTNRRFQANMYAPCKVFRTEKKGIGVMAEAEILPGEFIMEYVGEVLNGKQFEKRAKVYSTDKNKHYYFMALRSDAIIDATGKGNISRFINHSCDPNAETQKWTVNGELRIGFFCTKRTLPGEEITFDYQFQRYGKEAQKCFCESENCRGWIGEEPSSDEEDEDEEEEDEEEAEDKVEAKSLDQKTIPDHLHPLREVMKTDAENKALEGTQNDAKVDPSKLEKENDPTFVPDQRQKVPTLDKKVKSTNLKKPKVKKEFRPKKVDLHDELDLAKEIASLRASGLKNQAHTLKLSRLMVRAKLIKTRTELLKILYKGEMPCRRLFLDYHGLRLLHGWMIETETADAEEDLEFRLLIAETLEVLPISNKTLLKESRVFEIVQNWSKDKITISSSPDESPTNNDCNSNSNSNPRSAQSAVASNVAETDDYHPVKCEIIRISTKLIALWENLPEVFRIPKKERIEQMKEHEREADRQYKALSLADDTDTYQARNKERFGLNKTNKSFKPKKIRTENNNDLPRINPDLSKDERRKLFAEHVAKSMALKKELELRRTFEAKCKFFGFDPVKLNPVDMPVSYGKQTGQWYAANQRKIQTPPSQLHIPVQIRSKSTNPDDYILPKMELPPYWRFAIDKRGRIYYYHVQARVPQWEPPSKTSQATNGSEECIIRKEVTTQTKCESSDSDSSDTDLSSEWEGVINEENDNDSVTRDKVIQMRHGKRKKRQDLLVQKRTISPRREEDRLYNQSEMKRYRENKEKIRKRKEDIKRRKLQILMKQQEESLNSPLAEETLRNIAAQLPLTAPLPIQDFLISSDEDDVKMECDATLIEKFVQGDKIVDELDALNKERSMKLKQSIKLKSDKKRVKVGLEKRKVDGITTSSVDIISSTINNSIKSSASNLIVNSSKSIKRRKTEVESDTGSINLSASLKHQFRKAKEKFRNDIAGIIVHHLTPYRKETCTVGKITNTEDFKHLARKLTHFVMIKELKHCGSTGHSLVVTESVKNKSREFIRKYMTKYGKTYVRPENDPEFREI